MNVNDALGLAAFILTLLGTSWKLHADISSIKVNLQTEISAIRVILERLSTKFEQVDKLEKRIDRLERKVFHVQDSDDKD